MAEQILVDLHCHSARSHDGHTSWVDLAVRSAELGLHAVAITDHDIGALPEEALRAFEGSGVRLIPGCEVTCARGVHLIVLWASPPPSGLSPSEVARAAAAAGGVVLIPHPFKPGSGLLAEFPETDVAGETLERARWVEGWNGGWEGSPDSHGPNRTALSHELEVVATSDAHKVWHVGYFATSFVLPNWRGMAGGRVVDPAEFDGGRVARRWRWVPAQGRPGRRSSDVPARLVRIQRTAAYGRLVTLLPRVFKRGLKRMQYRFQRARWVQRENSGAYEQI